jgi:hypothetical protein
VESRYEMYVYFVAVHDYGEVAFTPVIVDNVLAKLSHHLRLLRAVCDM